MREIFSVVTAACLAALAPAQTCDQWFADQGFAAHGGQAGASIMFDDGTGPALYVAGGFDGITSGRNAIAKWNGTSFVSVGGDVPGMGAALAVFDEDGPGPTPPALYLTGSFTSAGGVSAHNIARWNGSAWSALGEGLSSSAEALALAVYDDGQGPALIAGGSFTSAGGAPANHLAMWRAGVWTELGGGVLGNASVPAVVKALAVYNGALYVGGSFVSAGSLSVTSIARWQNGAWSSLTTLGNGGGSYPSVSDLLAVQLPAIGPVLVAAGVFNAGSSYAIAAWNGTTWSGLGVTSSTSHTAPSSIGVYDSGNGPRLLASGTFGPSSGLIGWNGTSWDVVAPSTGAINTMTQTGPGALFVGGSVTQLQGAAVPYAATFQNGAAIPMGDFGHGFDGSIYALQTLDAGDGPYLYAAGWFDVADGHICGGIARRIGDAWVPLAADLRNNGRPGTIRAIAAFDDGSGPALYAGGSFLTIDGVAALNIARWRPATGWQAVGPGLNDIPSLTASIGGIYALAIHDDNGASPPGPSLYAAGQITYTGTTPGIGHVARWTGSGWVPVGSGLGAGLDIPLAMASFDPDGAGPLGAQLWVGGKYGLLRRWDGTSWTSPAGVPAVGSVSALFPTDVAGGPAMYVGGSFGAPFHTSVVVFTSDAWYQVGQRLSPDPGASGVDIIPGADAFCVIEGDAAPGLCAAGSFYDANYSIFNIAVLHDQQWTPIQRGLASSSSTTYAVRALATSGSGPERRLWAGGTFDHYYVNGADDVGAPSSNIAAFTPCRRCTSDVDGDGDSATDADIEAFFACLAGNCCPACTPDFNADGDDATDADIESFFRVLAGGHC